MNNDNTDVAGKDLRLAFGGLGLCVLAALIVTLLG